MSLLDTAPGFDRRRFLTRSAVVGGTLLTLPIIQSMTMPAAAAAKSKHTATLTQTGCSVNGNNSRVTYTIGLAGYDAGTRVNITVHFTGAGAPGDDMFSNVLIAAGGTATVGTQTGNAARNTVYGVTITVTYTQPAGSPDTFMATVTSC